MKVIDRIGYGIVCLLLIILGFSILGKIDILGWIFGLINEDIFMAINGIIFIFLGLVFLIYLISGDKNG